MLLSTHFRSCPNLPWWWDSFTKSNSITSTVTEMKMISSLCKYHTSSYQNWVVLQPTWLASSWSSHPTFKWLIIIMMMVMNGGENKTYPGLPSLFTLGAACDSKPTSKHSQAHPQNPRCLIEGGDAEPFNMSTQIRPDATAVWSRSEH